MFSDMPISVFQRYLIQILSRKFHSKLTEIASTIDRLLGGYKETVTAGF